MIPALANHLWQSTIFACVVTLVTLALRQNQARTRHTLWLAASVKFLVPFSLLIALGSQVQWRTAPPAPPPSLSFTMEELSQPLAKAPIVASSPAAPVPVNWIPPTLISLWLCGVAAILTRWMLRWRRITRTVRAAQPVTSGCEWEALRWVEHAAGIRKPIPLVSSAAPLEPGVFGILRPVLWLPGGIAEHLSDVQLESIFAHELCHTRRRDNLAATLHMLVEALFWFHPLVWWIGARLVEERERACDEEVVRLGSDPEVYAESILQVCRFCLESPLPCVSGITGADLQRRIETIMTPRLARHLNLGKKLLLASLGIAAVAGPIAIGLLHAPRSRAQSQPRTAAPLAFEVASVKPLDQTWIEILPHRSGGRVSWKINLNVLILYAYHLQSWRIAGLPPHGTVYQIDATTDPAVTEDQVRLMFQTLLAERFKMTAHRATKEINGYALTVGKGGFKLSEARPGDKPAPAPEWSNNSGAFDPGLDGKVLNTIEAPGILAIIGRRVPISKLAEALQQPLGAFVLDKTGLPGNYYFAFRFAREDAPEDVDVPSLISAVQELGLRLEKQKGPAEMLVIDHIEKTPAENSPEPEPEPEQPSGPHEAQSAPAAPAPRSLIPSLTDLQQSTAPAAPLEFEVASVKALPPGLALNDLGRAGKIYAKIDSAQVDIAGNTLSDLIGLAFRVTSDHIVGPKWMADARFNIFAKLPQGASKDQVPEMLQALLAERLKLAIHHEQRTVPIYALLADPAALKLQESAKDDSAPVDCNSAPPDGHHLCHKVSMAMLADLLTRFARMSLAAPPGVMSWAVDRPVVDMTGLKGVYDFSLDYGVLGVERPGPGGRVSSADAPTDVRVEVSVVAALKKVGLKLDPRKLPFDHIVVDHVEKTPAEN